jgi:hypothetical protein
MESHISSSTDRTGGQVGPDGDRPGGTNVEQVVRRTATAARVFDGSEVAPVVAEYAGLAVDGLTRMYGVTTGFPQTARWQSPTTLSTEGASVRYTAIAALGIARMPVEVQRGILAGSHAADLTQSVMNWALAGTDPGAVALATWLAAELGDTTEAGRGVERIRELVTGGTAIPTVDQAWMLTALVEYGLAVDEHGTANELLARLLRHQGDRGLFPHVLPPDGQNRLRAHIGCFADQVYPIQALARYARATGDAEALKAAGRCADRIVELQGAAGQWWWHYDARTGDVVEGFPVYSVHQHAMAPMALFDLYEAGGPDHRAAVVLGLGWIAHHPELPGESLIAAGAGVIWRKIGRREPRKATRTIRSVTTALRPGLRLGALDALFPPGRVDRECRPYELGWLLYAWATATDNEAL